MYNTSVLNQVSVTQTDSNGRGAALKGHGTAPGDSLGAPAGLPWNCHCVSWRCHAHTERGRFQTPMWVGISDCFWSCGDNNPNILLVKASDYQSNRKYSKSFFSKTFGAIFGPIWASPRPGFWRRWTRLLPQYGCSQFSSKSGFWEAISWPFFVLKNTDIRFLKQCFLTPKKIYK